MLPGAWHCAILVSRHALFILLFLCPATAYSTQVTFRAVGLILSTGSCTICRLLRYSRHEKTQFPTAVALRWWGTTALAFASTLARGSLGKFSG